MNPAPPPLPDIRGVVGGFASDGSLLLSGDAEAIARLAELFERHQPGEYVLAGGEPLAPPFDNRLRWLSLATTTGRLLISRNQDIVCFAASEHVHGLLARDLRSLLTDPSGEGNHLHFDYFPDHPLLEEGTEELVVELQ